MDREDDRDDRQTGKEDSGSDTSWTRSCPRPTVLFVFPTEWWTGPLGLVLGSGSEISRVCGSTCLIRQSLDDANVVDCSTSFQALYENMPPHTLLIASDGAELQSVFL